jgi:hypothetical protein
VTWAPSLGDWVAVTDDFDETMVARLVAPLPPDRWVMDRPWPGLGPPATATMATWVRRLATPEEIALVQLESHDL